jgi:hypothetical protein
LQKILNVGVIGCIAHPPEQNIFKQCEDVEEKAKEKETKEEKETEAEKKTKAGRSSSSRQEAAART